MTPLSGEDFADGPRARSKLAVGAGGEEAEVAGTLEACAETAGGDDRVRIHAVAAGEEDAEGVAADGLRSGEVPDTGACVRGHRGELPELGGEVLDGDRAAQLVHEEVHGVAAAEA